MFDTNRALADMASQIRTSRSADGLTLQQLASRSGVAASTIHKVEAQQMVPTVSVLLKIAKGLGRRPEELIRDQDLYASPAWEDLGDAQRAIRAETGARPGSDGRAAQPKRTPRAKLDVGVWRIVVSADRGLPALDLDPRQRAIVLVEQGAVQLRAGGREVEMDAGDCVEIEGGRIETSDGLRGSARLTLIASPPGNLDRWLGRPRPSSAVLR